MTLQEIQILLKEKFPDLTFKLFNYNKKQRIYTQVYHKKSDTTFEALFELDGKYLTITYSFGIIKSDYEALFLVNKFNIKTLPCFRAEIDRFSSNQKDYLIIKYFQPIELPNHVPNIFFNSVNGLMNNTEFKILKKHIIESEILKRMN